MQKSAVFNINLNAKDNGHWTAFHWTCKYGLASIVEVMMEKADYVNLDFTIKDLDGKTGLDLAQNAGKTEVVKLIKRKLKSISL